MNETRLHLYRLDDILRGLRDALERRAVRRERILRRRRKASAKPELGNFRFDPRIDDVFDRSDEA